ncbi:hypothetical protein C1645_735423 [Glomus cerebriforme]|uniref:Uncharacterized protein n=1 Tax=Glomus cerebriforme TaxID=658196 RepID=A0A397TFB5_9GLOM|nr:hypothetical protein C1645_735423 [Glomus cerebriforme]
MRVKHNKVYLYNNSFEYIQTAKSWSEAAKISGAVSYKIVYKYLDSGELFEDSWYFFSKEFASERISELKATTNAKDIPNLLANESYQGQIIIIYLYKCSKVHKRRSYQLVKVAEDVLEAANFLNTSCKIVERHLNSNKHFKIGKDNKYLICSKKIKDGDDFNLNLGI